jgi:hypothetical protein
VAGIALPLAPHPSSPRSPVRAIHVAVTISGQDLQAHFRIEGELGRVRIPAASAPRRVDGLWRHTCCELFVAAPGDESYRELNFSPSREWAAYAFDAYRQRADDPQIEPRIATRTAEGALELDIEVAGIDTAPLHIAAAAVIEDAEGALSYWALFHPPGKPDFHHRDGFALRLE